MSTTQHTATETAAIPPGAEAEPVVIGEGQPQGEEYPETGQVTMSEEELKAKEAAEADARERRASRAKGPRKLNPNERKVVEYFLATYIAENDPVTKTVAFAELHPDMKPFFQPSMKDNVIGRGVFNAVYDETTRALTGVQLTESGAELYFRLTRKSNGNEEQTTGRKAKGTRVTGNTVSRATKYPDNLRLRKLGDTNPRQTDSHGYHAYNLYENGMTYNQYLKKAFDTTLKSGGSGAAFSGPKRVHWDWDINHGHIGLYYEGVPEFLEDGSPNPNFWYVNMAPNKTAPTTNEPAESAAVE